MQRVSEKNNFLYLVISLVCLLLVGAIVDQFPSKLGQHLFLSITVITLATGIMGVKSVPKWLHRGIGFIISVLIIVIVGFLLDVAGMSYLHLLILTLFYIWAIWLAAKQVLFSGVIDGNKIVGAICIYLLMGIAQAIPGAFNGMEQAVWYSNFSDMAYYSFVTLTTLGYGDISPVVPIAKFLVYMEAIVGVFYMAILVASLIGIRISGVQQEKTKV